MTVPDCACLCLSVRARVPALLEATQTGDAAKWSMPFFDDVAHAHVAGAEGSTEACCESEQPSSTAAPTGLRV